MLSRARCFAEGGRQVVLLEHGRGTENLRAEFLLDAAMVCVALVNDDTDLIAMPRTLDEYTAGGATGMPLLHPYANRLATDEFDAYGAHFDAHDAPHDRHGLPIHGTMHDRSFTQYDLAAADDQALVQASYRFDEPEQLRSFPFPHDLDVVASVSSSRLHVRTIVTNTGDRPMPVSFGWHPFFTLPSRPRADWVLRLPACRRHVLDDHLLPTGATVEQAEDRSPVGDRTYDDHFDLGADRRFEISDGTRTLRIDFDEHYPHAQIYLPGPDWPLTGDFVCIEPMVANTNALVTETAPAVEPYGNFSAAFSITVT